MSKRDAADRMVLVSVVVAILVIGSLVLMGITSWQNENRQYKQEQKQEQKFANEFYAQCMKAHGVYDVGNNGYICFGNGSILFQSGFSQDMSPSK
jgi:hypothetical protein